MTQFELIGKIVQALYVRKIDRRVLNKIRSQLDLLEYLVEHEERTAWQASTPTAIPGLNCCVCGASGPTLYNDSSFLGGAPIWYCPEHLPSQEPGASPKPGDHRRNEALVLGLAKDMSHRWAEFLKTLEGKEMRNAK